METGCWILRPVHTFAMGAACLILLKAARSYGMMEAKRQSTRIKPGSPWLPIWLPNEGKTTTFGNQAANSVFTLFL